MPHTPAPWRVVNIPSAGLMIEAKIFEGEQGIQPVYEVSITPELYIGKEDGRIYVRLAYESYRQFGSENWKETQRANAEFIVLAVNNFEKMRATIKDLIENQDALSVGAALELLKKLDGASA